MTSYVLSQGTADRLKQLLNTSAVAGSGASGGSNRQEGWVEITVAEEGEYEGSVSYYDAVAQSWETFASVKALPANDDDTLVVGRRYMGQRSGDTADGESVWVVSASSGVEACCGLRIVEEEDDPSGCDPGTIVLDGESAAGEGINWNEEDCNFYLDIGDCLEIGEDGKLNVNISGTFSAVTSVYLASGCPSPKLGIVTTAFSFNGCSLEQDSYSSSTISLPCCYPCIDDPPPPPCDECNFNVTINGFTYAFELTGSTYIAPGPDGNTLYLQKPGSDECDGFWAVQLYDGNQELCKWEAEWDGTGCVFLEQGTNNGIPFTECPAEFAELCCGGDVTFNCGCADGVPADLTFTVLGLEGLGCTCDPSGSGGAMTFEAPDRWIWDGTLCGELFHIEVYCNGSAPGIPEDLDADITWGIETLEHLTVGDSGDIEPTCEPEFYAATRTGFFMLPCDMGMGTLHWAIHE
jgi:hypothetical protein